LSVKTYSGKDVGKYIEPALEKAKKRIIVISPWISKKYLDLLIQKAREGVKVIIVTSSKNKNLKDFENACGTEGNGGSLLILFFMLFVAFLYYYQLPWIPGIIKVVFPFLFFGLSLWLLIWKTIREAERRISLPLEIYVVDDTHFVHSKIYVFDDIVITGSANLTQHGLWKNTESIVIFPKGQQRSVLNDARKIINKAKKEAIVSVNCLEG